MPGAGPSGFRGQQTNREGIGVSELVLSLGLRLSLPWHCLGEPPLVDPAGRYPHSWLQEFLYSPPQDLEDRGLAVQVSNWLRNLGCGCMIGTVAVSLIQAPGSTLSALVSLTCSFSPTTSAGCSGVKGSQLEATLAHHPSPQLFRKLSCQDGGDQGVHTGGTALTTPPLFRGLSTGSTLARRLGSSSANPMLASGGPSTSLSVQLFPQPWVAGTLDVGSSSLQSLSLGQGLVRKAGAAFGQQLGTGSTALAIPTGSYMLSTDLGRPRTRTRPGPRARSAH